MASEYKVIPEAFYWTTAEKARRLERDLNRLAQDGWELAAIDPVTFLGFDVGYCLIVRRVTRQEGEAQTGRGST